MRRFKVFFLACLMVSFCSCRSEAFYLSIFTHNTNAFYLTSLIKLCNILDYEGKDNNVSAVLFVGRDSKADAKKISRGFYDFLLVNADRAYKDKISSIDDLSSKANYVTQLYKSYVYLLVAPGTKISKIQDLKGKNIVVQQGGIAKTLFNILKANNVELHDLNFATDRQRQILSARSCPTQEMDGIFYQGPDHDNRVEYYVNVCGYKVLPISLNDKLKSLYPYYKAEKISVSNTQSHVSTISVPIVALSGSDTSNYTIAFFLENFLNNVIPREKTFQIEGYQAKDYIENVTSLPLHPAATVVKKILLKGDKS